MFSGMEVAHLACLHRTTALLEIGAGSLLRFENQKGNDFEMLCGLVM